MAQTFSTGPVHVAFAPATAGTTTASNGTLYYGTTREGPDISEEPSYFNVMNDLAGPKLPLDRGYAGNEHTITLVMTRWDGSVDTLFDRYPNPFVGVANPLAAAGSDGPTDRGRLVSGITSCQLMMVLTNGNTVAGAGAATLPLFRRYFQTLCIGPNKPIWGNKENIRVRVFKAQNVFIGSAFATIPIPPNSNLLAFRLFDEGVTLPWTFTIT